MVGMCRIAHCMPSSASLFTASWAAFRVMPVVTSSASFPWRIGMPLPIRNGTELSVTTGSPPLASRM